VNGGSLTTVVRSHFGQRNCHWVLPCDLVESILTIVSPLQPGFVHWGFSGIRRSYSRYGSFPIGISTTDLCQGKSHAMPIICCIILSRHTLIAPRPTLPALSQTGLLTVARSDQGRIVTAICTGKPPGKLASPRPLRSDVGALDGRSAILQQSEPPGL